MMTLERFTKQVERLRGTFGERSYPDERVDALFTELRDFSDSEFEAATSHFILSTRHAPLLAEFLEAKTKLELERKDRARMEDPTVDYTLRSIPVDRNVNREFVNQCKKILSDYSQRRITRAQFDQGCDILDQAAAIYTEGVSGAPCRYCANSGTRTRDTEHGRFIYRCTCRVGASLPNELVYPERNGVRPVKPFPFYSPPRQSGRDRAAGEREE